MTTIIETPRVFIERVNLRGCIYRSHETTPDKRGLDLWWVGKDATRPCVIVDPTNNVATIDNLGWFTPTTTRAINLALDKYKVRVWQERWGHRVQSYCHAGGVHSAEWVAPTRDFTARKFLRYAVALSSGKLVDAPTDRWSL